MLSKDEIRQLLIRTKEGDQKARETVMMENIGLIWSVVRRFSNRGYERDDLFQIGSIGLIKAIDQFDLSYDVQFSTYAVPMITGEIKRFLRDDGMIKVSRSLKETAYRIRQVKDQFIEEHHREATIDELSSEMQIAREEIVVALEANTDVASMDQPVYTDDQHQILLSERVPGKENEEEQVLNHVLVEHLLNHLEETEKKVIDYRYFKGKTQQEIADILHISQVQVSRLEKKVLKKMRQQIVGHLEEM